MAIIGLLLILISLVWAVKEDKRSGGVFSRALFVFPTYNTMKRLQGTGTWRLAGIYGLVAVGVLLIFTDPVLSMA